jgi:hypothetical protein
MGVLEPVWSFTSGSYFSNSSKVVIGGSFRDSPYEFPFVMESNEHMAVPMSFAYPVIDNSWTIAAPNVFFGMNDN